MHLKVRHCFLHQTIMIQYLKRF